MTIELGDCWEKLKGVTGAMEEHIRLRLPKQSLTYPVRKHSELGIGLIGIIGLQVDAEIMQTVHARTHREMQGNGGFFARL